MINFKTIPTKTMDVQIFEKQKAEKTSRERQTFYRVTFNNNAQLLKIADNKANIIISINALVISSMVALIGFGSVAQQLDVGNLVNLIPIMLFILTCLSSTILAVQAAKPKIVGKPTGGSTEKHSLIFFGSVSYLSKDQYLAQLRDTMNSRGEIMDQMSTSLYYQSMVLNRKYKLLRQAYQAFMLGLILGVLAFLIQLLG
ncbi:Pycsar system effector family protein [Algoriphagus sp.]|uniref:Pycsar system effector family protein n=1 Tax=Algoriphagus sp. TaxID=1872435 RepID=UPI00262FA680|nr:Pycsar system effector family protein [Algoriphagus sp.]